MKLKVFTYKKGKRYYLCDFNIEKEAIDYARAIRGEFPGKIIVIEKETILHEIIKTIEG